MVNFMQTNYCTRNCKNVTISVQYRQ